MPVEPRETDIVTINIIYVTYRQNLGKSLRNKKIEYRLSINRFLKWLFMMHFVVMKLLQEML